MTAQSVAELAAELEQEKLHVRFFYILALFRQQWRLFLWLGFGPGWFACSSLGNIILCFKCCAVLVVRFSCVPRRREVMSSMSNRRHLPLFRLRVLAISRLK